MLKNQLFSKKSIYGLALVSVVLLAASCNSQTSTSKDMDENMEGMDHSNMQMQSPTETPSQANVQIKAETNAELNSSLGNIDTQINSLNSESTNIDSSVNEHQAP